MITIIGPGVIDVLAGAVDDKILSRMSSPMDFVEISFGGDALNEAVVLSRLGKQVQWVSKLGDDEAGRRVLNYAEENNLSVECVKVAAGMATGISIALVDNSGERRFLTSSKCTMRNFEAEDILPHVDHMAQIVSFASLFISYALDVEAMEQIFKRIKASGRTLAIDMKTPKHGETLEDLSGLLSCVDYFFPNESELATLTGSDDIHKNIEALLSHGLKCAVVKRGGKGCIIATDSAQIEIPACRVDKVIDTTGAGDCFAAGFLWALSEGWTLAECGRFACAVASCSVEEVGAVAGVKSLEQVMRRYKLK